jgi:hypothetical protein
MQLSPTLSTAYGVNCWVIRLVAIKSADSMHTLYCNLTSNDLMKSSVSTQQVGESMQNELLQLNIKTFQHVL